MNKIKFTGGHTVTWCGVEVTVCDDSGDKAVVDPFRPIFFSYRGGIEVHAVDGHPIGGVTFEEALFISRQTGQPIYGDHCAFTVKEVVAR